MTRVLRLLVHGSSEPEVPEPPPLWTRLLAAAAVALLVVVVRILRYDAAAADGTDFAQLWHGARALLAGENPYLAVGPGRTFDWNAPLLYPMPAVLLVTPLALLSLVAATNLFAGFGAFALAFAVTRVGIGGLVALGGVGYLYALEVAQWSPLLTGAALIPWLGFLLVAKPTVGLALFAYRPTWQAAAGCAALMALCFAVAPGWLHDWLHAVSSGTSVAVVSDASSGVADVAVGQRPSAWPYVAPIARSAGPLLLLALLRWRRPEARLLLGLALVPQTPLLYETVPLFLVARTRPQLMVLVALSFTAFLPTRFDSYESLQAWYDRSGEAILWCLYLPCLALVLRRRNEGAVPAWVEARLPRALQVARP